MNQQEKSILTLSVCYSLSSSQRQEEFINQLKVAFPKAEFHEAPKPEDQGQHIVLERMYYFSIQGHLFKIVFLCVQPPETMTQSFYDALLILSSIYLVNENDFDLGFIQYLEGLPILQQEYETSFFTQFMAPYVLQSGQIFECKSFKLRRLFTKEFKDSLVQQALSGSELLCKFFEDSLVQIVQNSFKETYEQHVCNHQMIPITVKPRQVLEDITHLLLKEVIFKEEKRIELYNQIKEGLSEILQERVKQIDENNEISCDLLCRLCDRLVAYLKDHKDDQRSALKTYMKAEIQTMLDETELSTFISARRDIYQQRVSLIMITLIDQLYLLLNEIIIALIEEDIVCTDFHDIMNDFLETFMCRITLELKEFSLVHSAPTYQFYQKIKEVVVALLQDVNFYLYKSSTLANRNMETLNDLMGQYHSLANVRTFQILQSETSKSIFEQIQKILHEEFFFYRPEVTMLEEELIKQTLRYFYTYSTENIGVYKISQKTKNFEQVMAMVGPEQSPKDSLTILESNQTFWFETLHRVDASYGNSMLFIQDTLLDRNIPSRFLKFSSDELSHPILHYQNNYFVVAYQDIYNVKTGRIALSVWVEDQNGSIYTQSKTIDDMQSLIFQIDHKNLNLIMHSHRSLSEDWESKSQLVRERHKLSDFIQMQRNKIEYYNSKFGVHEQALSQYKGGSRYERASMHHEKSMNNDELLKYKEYLFKRRKIQPQSALTNGSGSTAVAGGSIGAGIGCLIVDSMDPNIAWQEKLRRAGFTTLSTGMLGAAMRIPVVGTLISQAMLVYAVRKTMSNSVVSGSEKAKTIGHIGVQSSVGIGSAVAGQILIPIPVLGAIIGGTVGGVAIGLYQKLVIPKAKASMMKMLVNLEDRIMPDGLIVYDDKVIKIMKINKKHFEQTKPECLGASEWLTMVTVYLVNEVYYLFTLQNEQQIANLQDKLGQKPDDTKLRKQLTVLIEEFEQMEIMSINWERPRDYLTLNQIPTLLHAKAVGTFVDGMIQNFKL